MNTLHIMRFFSFIIGLSILVGGFAQTAEAQRAKQIKDTPFVADVLSDQMPKSELPDTIEVLSFPKMSFGESNKYFNDITTIQYQISLLNVLVERQRKNKEIQTAMTSIGVEYKEPAPVRSTCLELPKNKLCEKFYPELYGFGTAPALPPVDVSFQDFINERTLPETSVVTKTSRQKTPPKKAEVHYLWADISCIFDSCRAVLIPESGGSRFSVKVADEVGSKYVVGNIKAGHVDLIEKSTGDTVTLKPAPSSSTGGTSSPLVTGSVMDVSPVPVVDSEHVDAIIDTLKPEKPEKSGKPDKSGKEIEMVQ